MATTNVSSVFSSIGALAEPRLASAKVTGLTLLALLLTAIGLGTGVYSFIVGHEHLYAVTREVPWGILISSYAYFAIISTGLCLLAAISHLFGGNALAPLANRGVYLSIITILSAFSIIGMELESPWRMLIYNVLTPNLSSNIWWMGTLYGLAVACMAVEFLAILMGRFGIAVAVGCVGALAEVGANSNLGAVFATLAARPFWYGAQLPVYFLASAVTCGAAAIIMFTYLAYKLRGEEVDAETKAGLKSAGKILTMMLFLLAVATVWRTIVFFTGETELSSAAVANLLTGPASINFWLFETLIGMVIPIGLLLFSRMENLVAMASASFMVPVGAFFQRYDLVTVGQQTPVYYGLETSLPSFMGYAPSAGELLVVMGGISLTFLGFLAGERLFGKVFRHSGHH